MQMSCRATFYGIRRHKLGKYMAGRSTIDRMPEELRAAVDTAINAGATIGEIVDAVTALGGKVSKSALGRYIKRNAQLTERWRATEMTTKFWPSDLSDSTNPQMRILLRLAATPTTDNAMDELGTNAGCDQGSTGRKANACMSRALLNLVSAHELETAAEALLRRNERERSAFDGPATAKRGGASAETIEMIKRDILGLGDA